MEFKLVFKPEDYEQYKKFLGFMKREDRIIESGKDIVKEKIFDIKDDNKISNLVMEKKVTISDIRSANAIWEYFGALRDWMMYTEADSNEDKLWEEIMPALLIMDAVLSVKNKRVTNLITAEECFSRIKNKRELDTIEIIAGMQKGNSGYFRLNKGNVNSDISAAVYIETMGEKITKFKGALGGSGVKPFRLYEIENIVIGKNKEYLFKDRLLRLLCGIVSKKVLPDRTTDITNEDIENVYREALKKAFSRVDEKFDL